MIRNMTNSILRSGTGRLGPVWVAVCFSCTKLPGISPSRPSCLLAMYQLEYFDRLMIVRVSP